MDVIKKNIYKKYQTVFYREYNELDDNPNEQESDVFYSKTYHNGEIWKQQKFSITEEDFVKNYGNPACSVFCEVYTVVLEKDEDKVSIKIFANAKSRTNGVVYFRKGTQMQYLTYNLKTGDIYSGTVNNYHKKRGKNKSSIVRKNAFFKTPISTFFTKFKNIINGRGVNAGTLVSEYSKEFCKCLNIECTTEKIDDVIFQRNMIKKGFKLPNNYSTFTNFYPIFSKKESKKFKGKFIDVVMNREGLSGGRFKKILHTVNDFTKSYSAWRDVFGTDFLNLLPDDYIKKLFEHKEVYYDTNISFKDFKLLKSKKFIEIVKLVLDNQLNYASLIDHINFYNKLNRYEPTEWEACDLISFREEHMKYTERIEYYSNGVYKRYYDQKFVDHIQEKILIDGIEYNPIVLFDSKTYAEESNHQSNCVRTYIKKPQSFIISLRKGLDRLTLEYNISRTFNGKVKMLRVQSRSRFNQGVNESWDPALEILDNRIEKYLSKVGFVPPKITVSFKNGKTLSAIMDFKNDVNGESEASWQREEDPRQPLFDIRENFAQELNNQYRFENINIVNETPF
jgi:hypothetical protein